MDVCSGHHPEHRICARCLNGWCLAQLAAGGDPNCPTCRSALIPNGCDRGRDVSVIQTAMGMDL